MNIKKTLILIALIVTAVLVTRAWLTTDRSPDWLPGGKAELFYDHSELGVTFIIPDVWREEHYRILEERDEAGRLSIVFEYTNAGQNHPIFKITSFDEGDWLQAEQQKYHQLATDNGQVFVIKPATDNPFSPPDRQRFDKMLSDLDELKESFAIIDDLDLTTKKIKLTGLDQTESTRPMIVWHSEDQTEQVTEVHPEIRVELTARSELLNWSEFYDFYHRSDELAGARYEIEVDPNDLVVMIRQI